MSGNEKPKSRKAEKPKSRKAEKPKSRKAEKPKSRKAEKPKSHIPEPYRTAIRHTVKELQNWPDVRHLEIDKLTDDNEQRRKLVIGNYRVLWKVVKGQPVIVEILEVLRCTSKTYSKR